MVYVFHEIKTEGERTFVLFNQKAKPGDPLAVEVQAFLSGQYEQAFTLPSEQLNRALREVVRRDFYPIEQKLA